MGTKLSLRFRRDGTKRPGAALPWPLDPKEPKGLDHQPHFRHPRQALVAEAFEALLREQTDAVAMV